MRAMKCKFDSVKEAHVEREGVYSFQDRVRSTQTKATESLLNIMAVWCSESLRLCERMSADLEKQHHSPALVELVQNRT